MKKQSNTLFLAQSAMIAAIYVVLTVILAPFSYGEVQVRVSEALTILPVFTPAAIPGLFVGCLISNILGGCILPDIIFGSIATLLGACFTYLLRNRNKFLAPLPPIISNILIVPFVLHYGYQVPLPIPFLMGTVGIGEVISCGILGMIVYTILDKHRVAIFRTAALLFKRFRGNRQGLVQAGLWFVARIKKRRGICFHRYLFFFMHIFLLSDY